MKSIGYPIQTSSKREYVLRKCVLLVVLMMVFAPVSDSIAQETYGFTIARIKYDGGGDWYSDPE